MDQFSNENESFEMADFAKEVISQPELIESFNRYKTDFQSKHSV